MTSGARGLTLVLIAIVAIAFVTWRTWQGFTAVPQVAGAGDLDPIDPRLAAEPRSAGPATARDSEPRRSAASVDPIAGPTPLEPSAPAVDVAVWTHAGNPVADVSVRVVGWQIGGSGSSRFGEARTGRDGRARVPVDERLERIAALGVQLEFAVEVDVPLPGVPRPELGPSPIGQPPVDVVLPPFGAATVTVLQPDGALASEPGPQVFLSWRPLGSDTGFDRIGIPSAAVIDGVARFAIVPIGMELRFGASGSARFLSGQVDVPGPTRVGEVIEATVTLGAEQAIVAARVVDETGSIRARAKLSVGVAAIPADAPADHVPDQRDVATHWQESDAEGRIELRVAPDGATRRVLLVELDDQHNGGGEMVRRGHIAVPAVLASGIVTDLGRIELAPDGVERLIVRGRVVDETGAGLAGASVSAGFFESGRWHVAHRSQIRTAADGSFTIRSAEPAAPILTVSAAHGRLVPASVYVALGTSDVELRLAIAGKLTAWVRAPAVIPLALVVGSIRGEGRDGEPNQFAGRFGYDNLPGGTYDVVIRVRDSNWELARVTGVTVPAGGEADDPRIEGIDLTDRCRAWKLLVLDATGAPLGQARVRLTDADGRGCSVQTDSRGRLVAVAPADRLELRVSVDDLAATVIWTADQQTVRLSSN